MSIVNRTAHMRGLGEAPVTQPAPPPVYEEAAEYVIDRSLTASQELLDLALNIDGDSDFLWMGTKGTQTGDYEIRFRLPSGRYLSSARVCNANAVGSGQFPVPILPALKLPRSGQLRYDIKDLSGDANTVQIVLVGKRIFPTA